MEPRRDAPEAGEQIVFFSDRELADVTVQSDADRIPLEEFVPGRLALRRNPGGQAPELGNHAAIVPRNQGNDAPCRNALLASSSGCPSPSMSLAR